MSILTTSNFKGDPLTTGISNDNHSAELHQLVGEKWQSIFKKSELFRLVHSQKFDKNLYAFYLIETYHYTRHNSRNQALVATRTENLDPRYAKFCLEHASEEFGHEYMALHDLKAIGLEIKESEMPRPLPATEALTSYLYHISQKGSPYRRMGYSFWAENVYEYIGPSLKVLAEVCKLSPNQMTFFVAHSEIDKKHARDLENAISSFVKTKEDWDQLKEAALESLDLTARMLDQIAQKYLQTLV